MTWSISSSSSSGVLMPGDSLPLFPLRWSTSRCFCGRSCMEDGPCFLLERVVGLAPFIVAAIASCCACELLDWDEKAHRTGANAGGMVVNDNRDGRGRVGSARVNRLAAVVVVVEKQSARLTKAKLLRSGRKERLIQRKFASRQGETKVAFECNHCVQCSIRCLRRTISLSTLVAWGEVRLSISKCTGRSC